MKNMLNTDIFIEEINKAIADHKLWKTKLKSYIYDNNTTLNISEVRHHNKCEFGKWLYNIPSLILPLESINHYNKIKLLHAEFHEIAHETVELFHNGDKDNAKYSMENGDFINVSTELILRLIDWKDYLNNN